jgi:hypothetical protein
MILRRYVGRATGAHRKKKGFYPWPFLSLPTLFLATIGMALILVAVLIINPGATFPDDEKGSQPSSEVTPTPTTTPPPSDKHHGTVS